MNIICREIARLFREAAAERPVFISADHHLCRIEKRDAPQSRGSAEDSEMLSGSGAVQLLLCQCMQDWAGLCSRGIDI